MKFLSSVESLKSFFEWSSVVLLAFTFVAGAGVVITSRIVNKRQERTILGLQKDASDAKSNQQKVETTLAQAQTRQAEAEQSLLELRSKLAWRTITDENKKDFIAFVAGAPKGQVAMQYLTNNEEVAAFTMQLADLLRAAGYDAPNSLNAMNAMMPFGGGMVGVTLFVKDANNEIAGPLQRGLGNIGIEAVGQITPPGYSEHDVLIQVGAKSTK